MKILFLGNSITRHLPAPEIGWSGDYGMAASCEACDYVHVVLRKLSEINIAAEAMIRNIADFERDPAWLDAAKLAELRDFQANVIILRISENIPDDRVADFWKPATAMLDAILFERKAKIFVSGSFWKREAADHCMRMIAARVGGVFVPLDALQSEKYQAIGQFTNAGVAMHPSDFGMEKIAIAIFDSMVQHLNLQA